MRRKELKTNQVTLTFKRTELLDDIRQYAYVEGDIMDEKQEHAKHQVFDIAEDGNIDRVTRVLALAHAECVEALFPFTKVNVDDEEERDDELIEEDKYIIEMLVPKSFSKTTVDILEKYIHEYLICRVLSDWFSITNPGSAKNWADKAEDAKASMLKSKSIRTITARRGKSPF